MTARLYPCRVHAATLELLFLTGLRGVVSGPFLLVGFHYCDSLSERLRLPVVGVFPLDRILNGEDMFTTQLPTLEVGTVAPGVLRIGVDGVFFRA
jgi:hypothetical protein